MEGAITINTQGIQEWIVPKSGTYMIEAWGAKGGYSENGGNRNGAKISGRFDLQKNEILYIAVGQMGQDDLGDRDAGSGGGTFVTKGTTRMTSVPLIVAGGGSGTPSDANANPGSASQVPTGVLGAVRGIGHGGGDGSGTGGGGWFSDGLDLDGYQSGGHGFLTLVDPLIGGVGQHGDGGFGGGSGGIDEKGTAGGGYTGGTGRDNQDNATGGGGSYNAGYNQFNYSGLNDGTGKAFIHLMGKPKLESAGQTDLFIAKFNLDGTVSEATQGSGSGIDSVNGIALGKYNEIYITGVYGPDFQLGDFNASGDSTIVNAFHAQLNDNLETQWISTLGGGGFNRGESVAVDSKGRAFFVGSYTGTAEFEEKSLTAIGGADAYLAEYDYRGNVLRLISHGGEAGDAGTAIALDNDGGIIMTGSYQQEAHIFDGEHICHEHGGTDVFVARYDYGIQEPETHFVVEVIEDDNGTETILINDEPAPTLELIPGLEYTFEMDENSTEEHPFVIVEEGDGGSDLWEVEEDVNRTENIVTIKIDEDTPIDLGYGSENEAGLGGVIEVKQDPKPSYSLTIAQFDDGSNNVDGAEIKVFKNGQEVTLDGPFEEGTRLRVQLDPNEEFVFEGWQGDLPEDANRSFSEDQTFVITMDQDRILKAYFSTLAPDDPRDFLDRIEFFIQAKEVDEFGAETGEVKPPYAIVFEVDQGGVSEDGTSGSITIVSNGPDFDEPADGLSDRVEGRFIFEQTDEAEGIFRIVQSTALLSSSGQRVDIWGGGMEMNIIFRKEGSASGEAGQFVMFKEDGSTEQGDWDAEQIREDFSLID